MWRALAIVIVMTGCSRLFDLEPPVLDDSKTDAGDGKRDAPGPPGDGVYDGGYDGQSFQGCPASYTTVLGVTSTRYRIVTNMAISWDSAQNQCLADQIMNATKYTHLVVGASDIELSALDSATNNQIWVGLSDRAIEASFQWVTQETNNYPPASGGPWGANEPKQSGAEDCVYMNDTGDLAVTSCGVGKNFVCECDGFMNDPTKY